MFSRLREQVGNKLSGQHIFIDGPFHSDAFSLGQEIPDYVLPFNVSELLKRVPDNADSTWVSVTSTLSPEMAAQHKEAIPSVRIIDIFLSPKDPLIDPEQLNQTPGRRGISTPDLQHGLQTFHTQMIEALGLNNDESKELFKPEKDPLDFEETKQMPQFPFPCSGYIFAYNTAHDLPYNVTEKGLVRIFTVPDTHTANQLRSTFKKGFMVDMHNYESGLQRGMSMDAGIQYTRRLQGSR